MVDQFTKWGECIPLPSQTADDTATTAVSEFFSRFGCPFTDQGRNSKVTFPCCLRGSQGTHHSVSVVGQRPGGDVQPHPHGRGAVICRQSKELLGLAPGADCRSFAFGREPELGLHGQQGGGRSKLQPTSSTLPPDLLYPAPRRGTPWTWRPTWWTLNRHCRPPMRQPGGRSALPRSG